MGEIAKGQKYFHNLTGKRFVILGIVNGNVSTEYDKEENESKGYCSEIPIGSFVWCLENNRFTLIEL